VTSDEQALLNPAGLNAIRRLAGHGIVVWGSRTFLSDHNFRYVAIRRFALGLEESIREGTELVVFEPNDEPLWATLRATVGAHMNDLYRRGAFFTSSSWISSKSRPTIRTRSSSSAATSTATSFLRSPTRYGCSSGSFSVANRCLVRLPAMSTPTASSTSEMRSLYSTISSSVTKRRSALFPIAMPRGDHPTSRSVAPRLHGPATDDAKKDAEPVTLAAVGEWGGRRTPCQVGGGCGSNQRGGEK